MKHSFCFNLAFQGPAAFFWLQVGKDFELLKTFLDFFYVKRRAVIRNISETVIYRKKKKDETRVLKYVNVSNERLFLI